MGDQAQTVLITETDRKHTCGAYILEITERWQSPGSFRLGESKELVVHQPIVNTPNRPQSHYHLRDIPANRWLTLKSFTGDLLPVQIHWNGVAMQVRVGPPTLKAEVLGVSTFSREWKFEVKLQGPATRTATFSHPSGGLSTTFHYTYPSENFRYSQLTHLFRFSGSLAEFTEVLVDRLPEKKWTPVRVPSGGELPVRLYREKDRVTVEWLGAAAPPVSNRTPAAETGYRQSDGGAASSDDLAKLAGDAAKAGLSLLSQWLKSRNKS